MKEVIPGIYQLQLPMLNTSLGHVNAYLVQGSNGYLLIDTGWNTDESFDSLERQLAEIGISFEDVSQILITHIHPDHYGLAGKLKQLSRAKIALHYVEKDSIESRYISIDKLLQQIAQWLHINGVPAKELHELQTASVGVIKFVATTLPDVILRGGETISNGTFSFQVLWTPGHSPGHISLYEPSQKILISGDYILPTITPHIGLYPQSSINPLDDYLKSLNAIKQLEVNLILPGHEHPFINLQQRIDELIRHHEQRNSEILETIKVKPKTAYQIATEMTWMSDIGGASWQKLAPWDKRMAVMETLAHLESMRFGKKVDKFLEDSTICYHAT